MSDAADRNTTQPSLQSRVIDKNRELDNKGLLRKRVKVILDTEHANCFEVDDLPYINFSSNDYLGLSRSANVIDALHKGAQDYGVGGTSSPLVTGYNQAHQQLEQVLCQATGHEAALLFCSGFSANNALMKSLFNDNDTVLADKLVHASVIDGLQESGAVIKRFLHNDLASANTHFERHAPCALLTESVFSMDGDIAPLAELSALCRQYNAWLIVDDAHGFGIIGDKGLGASTLAGDIHIDAQIVTFGKALGGQGAAILGSRELIDYLVANARHYIYSTALSPAMACAVCAAVEAIIERPSLNEQLQQNIDCFIEACKTKDITLTGSTTAIQPIIIGDSARTLAIAKRLKEHGFWVGAIRPPTVTQGSARLRITITAEHCAEDINAFVAVLADILQDD
ncbi:8-amino-7-oxononanoate synthase [Shewanella gelidimarina]|uniref:8-amino-7-oxononanoate synthase n=1 Tax=Shewanella gelidimarina TaxID=56813 RepID=UPI00200F1025|nr:8-amino-7-oxononanoate synthase [Shewanella gelidimarina]MCL1057966.1 8-amino-7-oxononanoate synthase [Shewanella gelidimarina]